ncbi:MAG: AbrB/MazE/SpoVT family DNA-binding domain-containing protein [Rhodocyclaceae bacterium]|nr:AbrB/MazE/SpoVT family DNA-binding domain-containing protein [Rhodocyclaceae bacterium]
MATATLRTLGGSVVMTIPKPLLEQARLRSGVRVEIEYRDGQLIIKPRPSPQYTLAELLARCEAGAYGKAAAEAEWLNDGPVGQEVL